MSPPPPLLSVVAVKSMANHRPVPIRVPSRVSKLWSCEGSCILHVAW